MLPFVFTRLGQPFRTSILPMLVGMAVSFAMVGWLAAVSGGWVVRANHLISWVEPPEMLELIDRFERQRGG